MNKTHGIKQGRPTTLTEEEEEEICAFMKTLGEWGFPSTSSDLRHFVKSYLDKKGVVTVFKDNMPTHRFTVKFVQRHKDLSMRTANPIKRARAAVSREDVEKFISNWGKTVEGVPPEAIINYDETNLRDDPGTRKCLFRKGTKYPEKVLNTSKQAYSVMFAGTAAGDLLPCMVVYKAANVYTAWKEHGPKDTEYACSASGWFDSCLFQQWFFNIVLPYLRRIAGKKVIVGDNLASHINSDVIAACKKHNIAFVCLPPNSTDKLQPLDVAVFAPLKKAWRSLLEDYKNKHPEEAGIPKVHFPRLLKKLLEKADPGHHLPAGFER